MATESRQATAAARIADGFEQASRRETTHLNALRSGHSWGSETSSGFDSNSGVRGGSNSEVSDRHSLSSGSSVQDRDSVGSGTRHQVEAGSNRVDSGQWSAGARVGMSVGGGEGKGGGGGGIVGKIASAVGLKGEVSGGYNRSLTNSDTSGTSDTGDTSRDASVSASNETSRNHSVSGTVSESDGTFHQSGEFSRSQNSESRTRAIEESLSRIQSYNEQARHYRELSQSLEQHASFSESSGFNLSQDLRQDLAKYYDKEVAGSPKGVLPGLWETNLTHTQEGMRNAAIGKWATQRSDEIERDIQSALQNPALEGIKIPEVASEGSVAGRYSGGSSLPAAHPVSSGRPSTAREDAHIKSSTAELVDDESRLNGRFTQSLRGAPAGPKVD